MEDTLADLETAYHRGSITVERCLMPRKAGPAFSLSELDGASRLCLAGLRSSNLTLPVFV